MKWCCFILTLILLLVPVGVFSDETNTNSIMALMNEREKQNNIQIQALRAELILEIKSLRSELFVTSSALEHRLEGMNQIRNQLDQQAKTFATKSDVEKMNMKIDMVKESVLRREGSAKWTDYMIMAAISAAVYLLLNRANGIIERNNHRKKGV